MGNHQFIDHAYRHPVFGLESAADHLPVLDGSDLQPGGSIHSRHGCHGRATVSSYAVAQSIAALLRINNGNGDDHAGLLIHHRCI